MDFDTLYRHEVDDDQLSASDFHDLQHAYLQATAIVERNIHVDDFVRLSIASNVLWVACNELPRSSEGAINKAAVAEMAAVNVLLKTKQTVLH